MASEFGKEEGKGQSKKRKGTVFGGIPKLPSLRTSSSSCSPSHPPNLSMASDHKEFGGRSGALGLMVFSHFILYYMYYCINLNHGAVFLPSSVSQATEEFSRLWGEVFPTPQSVAIYLGFLLAQVVFAFVLPGITVTGRPDEKGKIGAVYKCNALASWYATLAILAALQAYTHATGIPTVSVVTAILGRLMTTSIIFGDLASLALYVVGHLLGLTHRMSGDHVYDFFMGAILHPRIGVLNIKIWAEVRISWFILFTITLSCVVRQLEVFGAVSPSLLFMLLAHFLYANACAKGEHFIPTTWDMFYEKFGWMLCFWNFAGVPFLYCAQSVHLLRQSEELGHVYNPVSTWFVLFMVFGMLLPAYWIWDAAQFQKNAFRLKSLNDQNRAALERMTFPTIPGSRLKNPKFITTKRGTPILIDGWWKVARKIHYSADIVMALTWGLSCGFSYFLPYFYVAFFTGMILHRNQRDILLSRKKYGADWDKYVEAVPYAFIPGVY